MRSPAYMRKLNALSPCTLPELKIELIKWVPKGEYVRILGIPFWEPYDITLFYEKLYAKAKGLLATWKDHM